MSICFITIIFYLMVCLKLYITPSPLISPLTGIDKLDIQDIIKVSMEKLNTKHNNVYLYSYLVNGYRRFDPQRGMEYILDLALEDTSIVAEEGGRGDRIVQRRVLLVRPLGEVGTVTYIKQY